MNKVNSAINPWLISAAAVIACILSYAINVMFFASLGNNTWTSTLFGLASLIFETVKIISLTLSIWCFFQKRFVSLAISALIFTVLVVVSGLASVSVLNMNVKASQAATLLTDDKYKHITQQIEVETKSIATLQTSAAIDASKGYRERSNNTISRIKDKQKHLDVLHQQQQEIAALNHTPALEHIPPHLLQLSIIFLGSLLELATGYLLAIKKWQGVNCFVTGNATATENAATSNVTATATIVTGKHAVNDAVVTKAVAPLAFPIVTVPVAPKPCKKSIATRSATATATTSNATATATSQQQTIATVTQLLQKRKLQPTTRAIRDYCSCSTKKSCLILKALEQNSIVKKTRRGYAIA